MYLAPINEQEVKAVMKQYRLPANTGIGQHFLCDPAVVEASVDAANITKQDTVVEIGPGLGVLTQTLCERAGKVIVIELDKRFDPILQALQQQYPHLEIVYGDALQVDWSSLGVVSGEYKVVTNLPYQITAKFFRMLLTQAPYPASITALIQQEVAERIVAKPGKLSILGISVQLFAHSEIILHVPPQSFIPAPRVQSSVVHVTDIRKVDLLNAQDERLFFSIVKSAFAQKRKTLMNNLKNWQLESKKMSSELLAQWLAEEKMSPSARAQEVSIKSWLNLIDKLK